MTCCIKPRHVGMATDSVACLPVSGHASITDRRGCLQGDATAASNSNVYHEERAHLYRLRQQRHHIRTDSPDVLVRRVQTMQLDNMDRAIQAEEALAAQRIADRLIPNKVLGYQMQQCVSYHMQLRFEMAQCLFAHLQL